MHDRVNLDQQMLHGHLTVLILALLDRTPLHGYALRQKLPDLTGGRITTTFGRLYPLLADLEKRGFVTRSNKTVGEARIQTIYTITSTGRKELDLLRFKWERFSTAMHAILGSG